MEYSRSINFNAGVVSTETDNGFIAEGIYFTSNIVVYGENRIFCGFARPVNSHGSVPLVIELHGGGGHGDPSRALYYAKKLNAAVISLDWSGNAIPPLQAVPFVTQWKTVEPNPYLCSYNVVPDAESSSIWQIVTAVRRAIDFACLNTDINKNKIAVIGGSWGALLAQIVAGVDERVKYAGCNLGAGGFNKSSYSYIGGPALNLPEEQKKLWFDTFDPSQYKDTNKAVIFNYASSNDKFFWLGDLIDNYMIYSQGKRLLIWPNSDHWLGGDAVLNGITIDWLKCCFCNAESFPEITREPVLTKPLTWTWKVDGPLTITRSDLYFSPGNAIWPARYWIEIPGKRTGDFWTACMPQNFEGIGGKVFVNAFDSDNRAVSSLLAAVEGKDPGVEPTCLWDGKSFWDSSRDAKVWRADRGITSIYEVTSEKELRITPQNIQKGFSVATNSVIPASGHAQKHRGIRIGINGNGRGGKLNIGLTKDYLSKKEICFEKVIEYNAGTTETDILWSEFQNPECLNDMPYPFDGLVLSGRPEDGCMVTMVSCNMF